MSEIFSFVLGILVVLWSIDSEHRSETGVYVADILLCLLSLPFLWIQRPWRAIQIYQWKKRPDSYEKRKFFTSVMYHSTLLSIYRVPIYRILGKEWSHKKGQLPDWYEENAGQEPDLKGQFQ